VELSAPYGDQPLVAAAVPIPGGDLVLGVELSLAALTAIFEVGPGGDLALLDAGGSIVMGGQSGIIRPEAFRAFRGGALAEDIRYTDPDGIDVVAACAPLPSVGWTVVVAEPVASALAPIRQIQQRLGYMLLVAGALSLGLGVIFADQLSLPVVRLREAARRMAQGELGATVPATGRDEVAELTVAFNEMSLRLRQDADEIARKNSEIEGFNRDLQRRVDEATADLRAAQARLLRAARLEAAGELGAGLAHELNNPLASVLGGAQLLRARATEPSTRAMLDAVEREALRCRQIVAQLTALREPAGRTAPSPAVSLPDLAHHVTALVRGSFQERGIALVVDVDAEGPGVVDAAAGAQALTALLACARAAGGAGATVTLRRLAGEPILDLCQSGPVGDADDARAQGLAAWAASQLFATVGATVEAEAQDPAGGRRWRVRFAV
jgi:signal transduction histidine kinase